MSDPISKTTYWLVSPVIVICMALGFFVGGFSAALILDSLWPLSPEQRRATVPPTRDLLVSGAMLLCASTVNGVGNYGLLRLIYPRLPIVRWLLITDVAALSIALIIQILPVTLFTKLPTFVEASIIGAGFGCIIGCAQWAILRKYGTKTVWWIGASVFIWAATMLLLVLVTTTPNSSPNF